MTFQTSQCQHLQRYNISLWIRACLSEHQLFTLYFQFKLFHVSITIAIAVQVQDTDSSITIILIFYHKLAKFEQNRMIQTTQTLEQKAVDHVNYL